jgi:RNase P/RNase MRP subunit POP5
MTPPKPTLKQKRRYAIISYDREDLSYDEMKGMIIANYEALFGRVGMARARLLFLKNTQNTIICRINTDSLQHLRATILYISTHNRKSVCARTLLVSGTLKSLRAKFFKESSAPYN